jgi:hypothetical protein
MRGVQEVSFTAIDTARLGLRNDQLNIPVITENRGGVWAFSGRENFNIDPNFIRIHGKTSCICVILLDNILQVVFTLT